MEERVLKVVCRRAEKLERYAARLLENALGEVILLNSTAPETAEHKARKEQLDGMNKKNLGKPIAKNELPITSEGAYEVVNGLLGLKRDIVIRLLRLYSIARDIDKNRILIALCQITWSWKNHLYFKNTRKQYAGRTNLLILERIMRDELRAHWLSPLGKELQMVIVMSKNKEKALQTLADDTPKIIRTFTTVVRMMHYEQDDRDAHGVFENEVLEQKKIRSVSHYTRDHGFTFIVCDVLEACYNRSESEALDQYEWVLKGEEYRGMRIWGALLDRLLWAMPAEEIETLLLLTLDWKKLFRKNFPIISFVKTCWPILKKKKPTGIEKGLLGKKVAEDIERVVEGHEYLDSRAWGTSPSDYGF
ncbi:hypothetical protein AGMMS49949_00140 [Alphaproteobacteria bacterium]|nr:hypothetical protein AGMMS49949_00140 [Alphaproteobacteria bacterium]GHS95719.1 hypothetical protein AGMMS50296_0700 [Alphaproteobacteria bacterium]